MQQGCGQWLQLDEVPGLGMLESLVMEYEALDKQVNAAALEYSLAEIHGIATGMVCGQVRDMTAQWQELLFAETDPNDVLVGECKASLSAIPEQIQSELQGMDTRLELLLPDDEQSLQDRAMAVAEWCQGFLFGFGLGGEKTTSFLSAEAEEALRDFTEISRLDADSTDEDGLDESLAEIEEYLWVAAALIYQDLGRVEGKGYEH